MHLSWNLTQVEFGQFYPRVAISVDNFYLWESLLLSFLNFSHFLMMMLMIFSSCKPHLWLLNSFVRLPSAFSLFFG